MEVRAPYDGQLIATVDLGDGAAVEQALAAADALFRDRDAWLAPARRIEILRRTATLMEDRAENLAVEAAREGGKPLIDSRVEVARAIDGVLNCAEALRSQAGHMIPMDVNAASANRIAFTRHEPIGVVVAVSAFNHPLNLIVHQVGPAVAARVPGHRQARQRYAALVPALRRHPARGRASPSNGARRWSPDTATSRPSS